MAKVVVTYKFQANALYVCEVLESFKIHAALHSNVSDESQTSYSIKVSTNDLEEARNIISKLEIDETALNPDSEAYIEGHVEWSNKMYDPGHYLGGHVPHFVLDDQYQVIMLPVLMFLGFIAIIILMSLIT